MTSNALAPLEHGRALAGETLLIKLGGAALRDPALIHALCEDLARVRSAGASLVIVHGGGPLINDELRLHGIDWRFIDGQRVTTAEMMSVVEMVLCGSVNRRVVRALNAAGVPAVGMSGSDGGMLLCSRASPELGQVGRIEEVDPTWIRLALGSRLETGRGRIPVIAPTGFGHDGSAFNINADWAAVRIAEALGIGRLIFLTDQDGILDAGKQPIARLDPGELRKLIGSGAVQGGMLAKVRAMLHALDHGAREIHVLNACRTGRLLEELFTDQGVGTVCRRGGRAPQWNGISHEVPCQEEA